MLGPGRGKAERDDGEECRPAKETGHRRKQAGPGKELDIVIGTLDAAEQKVLLTLPNQNVDDGANANFKEYQASLKSHEPKPGSQVSKNEIGSLGLLLQEKFNQQKK